MGQLAEIIPLNNQRTPDAINEHGSIGERTGYRLWELHLIKDCSFNEEGKQAYAQECGANLRVVKRLKQYNRGEYIKCYNTFQVLYREWMEEQKRRRGQ